MCEVDSQEFRQDLGCTISVTGPLYSSPSSRKSLLPGFSRKKSRKSDNTTKASSEVDDQTADLIQQLRLEGRSDDNIATHLAHLNDIRPTTAPTKKRKTSIFKWLSSIPQLIKDEFALTQMVIVCPEAESDTKYLTVNISSAPFYGALPPVMDMSYAEFAAQEPVFVGGGKCINNLPSCTYDGTPLPGAQTDCPVCLVEFAKGDKLKSLPCVHFYHEDCIDAWLLVGHACPVCKKLVQ